MKCLELSYFKWHHLSTTSTHPLDLLLKSCAASQWRYFKGHREKKSLEYKFTHYFMFSLRSFNKPLLPMMQWAKSEILVIQRKIRVPMLEKQDVENKIKYAQKFIYLGTYQVKTARCFMLCLKAKAYQLFCH